MSAVQEEQTTASDRNGSGDSFQGFGFLSDRLSQRIVQERCQAGREQAHNGQNRYACHAGTIRYHRYQRRGENKYGPIGGEKRESLSEVIRCKKNVDQTENESWTDKGRRNGRTGRFAADAARRSIWVAGWAELIVLSLQPNRRICHHATNWS